MESAPASNDRTEPTSQPLPSARIAPSPPPAGWTRPFVAIDRWWTSLETGLVLALLILAILYMTGWVTLNAFHTKSGKLAKYPGSIALFAGIAVGITWARDRTKKIIGIVLPLVLIALGAALLYASKKQEYFANISRWLSDASLIKQIGTPQIVSARLFTIWVALLGGSLATGAGRQINIDVVMRFIGPKPRLIVALIGYFAASAACFVVTWGFLDYIAITRYAADKELRPKEKLSIIQKGFSRHMFIAKKQIGLDARAFVHVVLKGEQVDKWYTGAEWNADVNGGGWTATYPQPPMPPREPVTLEPGQAPPPPPPPPPQKPCLTSKEIEDLGNAGGSMNSEWKLISTCDGTGDQTPRLPLATAPEPDDRSPLEADLSLLFPMGFMMIGLRFLLRALLAVGGAVSTDPNAAHGGDEGGHGGDVAVHEPIAEHKVDEEARAHEGAKALPVDDTREDDAMRASKEMLAASIENLDAKKESAAEPVHHHVDEVGDKQQEREKKLSSRPPPEGVPTAERLEAAATAALQEEEETTLVGDLSELARAQELLEQQEAERKKNQSGGSGGGKGGK